MSRFNIDGVTVDTEKAVQSWEEDTNWDGSNQISVHTGSQWNHQTLYRSSKGRYYLVHSSQWQGGRDSAEFISNEDAACWLLLNNDELPDPLASFEDAVSE